MEKNIIKKSFVVKCENNDMDVELGIYKVDLIDMGFIEKRGKFCHAYCVDVRGDASYNVNNELEVTDLLKMKYEVFGLLNNSTSHNSFLDSRIDTCLSFGMQDNGYIGYMTDDIALYDEDIYRKK